MPTSAPWSRKGKLIFFAVVVVFSLAMTVMSGLAWAGDRRGGDVTATVVDVTRSKYVLRYITADATDCVAEMVRTTVDAQLQTHDTVRVHYSSTSPCSNVRPAGAPPLVPQVLPLLVPARRRDRFRGQPASAATP